MKLLKKEKSCDEFSIVDEKERLSWKSNDEQIEDEDKEIEQLTWVNCLEFFLITSRYEHAIIKWIEDIVLLER